jgi:GTP-binding protein
MLGSIGVFSVTDRPQGRRIVHYGRVCASLLTENMSRFGEARFLTSVASPAQFPNDFGAEVAFAGRSNSGKSSAINAIAQRRGLARTSKTPGRTRLLNYFELAPEKRLVDLPGYGYASVTAAERATWQSLLEVLRTRTALTGLFLIVDSRRGLTEADERLIDWAQRPHHLHVLLSKADKLNRAEAGAAVRAASDQLAGRGSVQLFSALRGTGVREAQETLAAWLGLGPRP